MATAEQTVSGQPIYSDNSVETLVRLGDHTLSRGDVASAIAMYRRAHAADQTELLPLLKLGSALASFGSYDEAAGAFRAALSIDPINVEALRGMGNAYLALNEPDLALPNLEAAIAIRPDPRASNSLGVAYDLLGRHDEAQEAYGRGLAVTPADLDIATNMALSLSLSGMHDDAVRLMRRTATAPSATARHRQNLALVYGLADRAVEARAVARLDLGEAAVEQNMAFYAMLQRIDDSRSRAAAIGESGGAAIAP
ncbi:MAG: tetratricopeptide repeat protein [Alphaproteobacteria bacterium]